MFDSLNSDYYVKYLADTIKRFDHELQFASIVQVQVPSQTGSDDCGCFAIAYAIELCKGNNPAFLEFQQEKMRAHLNDITSAYSAYTRVVPIESFPHAPIACNNVFKYFHLPLADIAISF
jgi:Ulp1 family protease